MWSKNFKIRTKKIKRRLFKNRRNIDHAINLIEVPECFPRRSRITDKGVS